jgi:hypothetical protein
MSKITRVQLAEEYRDSVNNNETGMKPWTAVKDAFLAGWAARKKIEQDELQYCSCICLKRLDEVE